MLNPERMLEQAQTTADLRLLSSGGIGEPLAHPQLPQVVARVKAQQLAAELVTNGTLLEPGLHLFKVSIDGTTPESYDDVRGTPLQRE